nr:MAG TPA: hypothetical protein [Caudoviricetes sp.]
MYSLNYYKNRIVYITDNQSNIFLLKNNLKKIKEKFGDFI